MWSWVFLLAAVAGTSACNGTVEVDSDCTPGTGEREILYISMRNYDEAGNVLSLSYDNDANGLPDRKTTWTYNEAGLLVREENEGGGDGDELQNSLTLYTYDEGGNRLSELSYNASGELIFEARTTYDDQGRPVTLDCEADPSAESRVGWIDIYTSYSEHGLVVTQGWDIDGDGAIDEQHVSVFDDEGRDLEERIDQDMDGVVDNIFTQTWDDQGNLLKRERDTDGDGNADSTETYTYNSTGQELTYEFDQDGDGVSDTLGFDFYDEGGSYIGYEIDRNADGTTDEIATYTYDADGHRLSSSFDFDANGSIDRRVTWSYRADGQVEFEENDQDLDGVPEVRTDYVYDAAGVLISSETTVSQLRQTSEGDCR